MHSPTGHFARTLRVVWQVIRHPVQRRVELAVLDFGALESGAWIAILLYAYQATGPHPSLNNLLEIGAERRVSDQAIVGR